MAEKKIHVFPAADGWMVKEEGGEGVTQHFDTKEGAIAAAEGLAQGAGLEVEVHTQTLND